MFEAIRTFVENHITGGSDGIRDLVILFFIAICALGMYYVTRALLRLIERIVLRTPTSWDDDLFNSRFLGAVSQLSPALVVKWMLPGFFGGDYRWLGAATSIYIVGAVVWILIVFIQNVYNGISHRPSLRAYAVKGVFQMVQLVLICVAVVYSVSIMVGKSPVAILTALGASAAVLMLVFKDTILGLVASVQLTANKMIQRGDWIVCEKHDADGEVVDISLTTVKVRNWDNSITTIPPYVLISESFRNYEPMRFSGGRRVCRSILIDANSVGFCSSAQLEGLREQGWLHGIGIEEAARVVNLQLLRRSEQLQVHNPCSLLDARQPCEQRHDSDGAPDASHAARSSFATVFFLPRGALEAVRGCAERYFRPHICCYRTVRAPHFPKPRRCRLCKNDRP